MTAGRALLDERPRTTAELEGDLQLMWPGKEAVRLAYAMRNFAPLVQIPPRGVWGASGRTTYATAETWLGRPLEANPAMSELIQRYPAAYGPSTVADIRAWSRLTGLAAEVEALPPQLRSFRDEHSRELFDIPDGLLPDPEPPRQCGTCPTTTTRSSPSPLRTPRAAPLHLRSPAEGNR